MDMSKTGISIFAFVQKFQSVLLGAFLFVFSLNSFAAIFEITPTGSGIFSKSVSAGVYATAEYRVLSHATTSVPITITYADKQDNFPAGMNVSSSSDCQSGKVLIPGSSCVLRLDFTPNASQIGQTLQGGPVISYKNIKWRSLPDVNNRINVTVGPAPTGKLAWQSTPVWQSMVQGAAPLTHTYIVENRGEGNTTISGIDFNSGGDSRLTITGGTCHVGSVLPKAATCTIDVKADPTAVGEVVQLLRVSNNGAASPLMSLINFAVNAAGSLEWTVEPVWKNMIKGVPAITQTYTLENRSGASATISNIDIVSPANSDSRLSITGGSCHAGLVLPALGSCTITIQADPTTTGIVSQKLQVTHTAVGSPLLSKIYFAVNPSIGELEWQVIPSWTDMVQGASPITKTYTLVNNGGLNVTLGSINLTPGDSRLTITGGTCSSGGVLIPGNTCTIDVQANPSSVGAISQVLQVNHDGIDTPLVDPIDFNVNAAGSLAWLTIPTWNNMTQGHPAIIKTYVLQNNGSAPATINTIGINPGDSQLAVVGGSCTTGMVLNPANICTIDVEATPTSIGNITQNLRVGHTGLGSPLDGIISFDVKAPGALVWLLEPNWPDMTQGSGPLTQTYIAQNNGGSDVYIIGLKFSPGDPRLSITGSGAGRCVVGDKLAPGDSCSIDVMANPGSTGDVVQTLQLAFSGVDLTSIIRFTINSPGDLKWKTIPSWNDMRLHDPNITKIYELEYSGPALSNVTINSRKIVSGDSRLTVTGGTCADGTILGFGYANSCTIEVQVNPATTGTVDQALLISHNGIGSPQASTIYFDINNVKCWGWNASGQTTESNKAFVELSAGYAYTCGRITDNKIACWGNNAAGQASPPSKTFSQISAGTAHTCGVKTDNAALCWGDNSYGRATPPVATFSEVTAGLEHTCGVKTDGTITCWGNNIYGQSSPIPAGIFYQASAGAYYTCGLKSDGTVVCWGDNTFGQLNPPAGTTFSQISAGSYHSCGVKTDSSVACWGSNNRQQANPPVGTTFSQVSAGEYHTCGLKPDGTVVCWGDNTYGQSSPPSGAFSQVSAGGYHTCGIIN